MIQVSAYKFSQIFVEIHVLCWKSFLVSVAFTNWNQYRRMHFPVDEYQFLGIRVVTDYRSSSLGVLNSA